MFVLNWLKELALSVVFAANWFGILALSVTSLLFWGLIYLYKKKIDFSLLTLIGLGLGIVVGIVFQGNLEFISPIGTIYAKVITAVVAPLIIFSILSSLTSLNDIKKLKTIGLRSVFWLLLNTFIAILLALGAGLVLGVGKNYPAVIDNINTSSLTDKLVSFSDVVVDFFPSNIIDDISNNRIIPIILFSLLIAVAYVLISGEHEEKVLPFKKFVDSTKEIIYTAVDFIIFLTPFAVLTLVATATSKLIGKAESASSTIVPLLSLLAITFAVCSIQAFIVNGALVAFAARLNPFKFFKKIANAQATAFTIQSSVGTLPVTINSLTKKVGVSEEVANFTAPLGATIGMPGCAGIWPILLSVFAIHALNIPYSLSQYFTLIVLALVVSLGTAGVPGTATVTATAVFTAAGLPVEIIILLLPISTIADMARTATNVTAAAVSAAIVARKEGQLDDAVFNGITSN